MCHCISAVRRDCELILEAIRRLRDGTWNLELEDLEQAYFLLPTVRAAIADHIEYEERFVFPRLEKAERDAHRTEHAELVSVLWGLDLALRERSAEKFHALLDVLKVLLTLHHGGGLAEAPEKEPTSNVLHVDFMQRISRRSQQSILESV